MGDKRYEEGLRIRRIVLGDEYVDGAVADEDDFTAMRQRFINEYHYGSVWARKELPLKIRSLITIAMLSGMNRSAELKLHVRGAMNTGCTIEEIREVFFHAGIYCGAGATNEGLRILNEIVAERENKAKPSRKGK